MPSKVIRRCPRTAFEHLVGTGSLGAGVHCAQACRSPLLCWPGAQATPVLSELLSASWRVTLWDTQPLVSVSRPAGLAALPCPCASRSLAGNGVALEIWPVPRPHLPKSWLALVLAIEPLCAASSPQEGPGFWALSPLSGGGDPVSPRACLSFPSREEQSISRDSASEGALRSPALHGAGRAQRCQDR